MSALLSRLCVHLYTVVASQITVRLPKEPVAGYGKPLSPRAPEVALCLEPSLGFTQATIRKGVILGASHL
jgi:hypothetical protein